MLPSRIFAALADLAPAGGERVLDVSKGGQPIVWLRDPDRAPAGRAADRLAALDALHHDERILRRSWAWVIGGTEVDGVRRRVRLPLLAEPVRLYRGLRGYRVVPAGDLEVTPLVADRALAAALEDAPGLGNAAWLGATGSAAWLRAAAAAAGVVPQRVVADEPPPHSSDDDLVGYAVAALYVVRDVSSVGLRDTLLTWAGRGGLESTALAHVYGATHPASDRPASSPPAIEPPAIAPRAAEPPAIAPRAAEPAPAEPRAAEPAAAEPVLSPLPLNAAQREVVRRVRREPVVVVSGPPGNGKSHAVVAAALDTIDRGGSVLVATQSARAAEVVGELLGRYPGPVPVLFGNSEGRHAVAAALAEGADAGVDDRRLRADDDAVAAAERRVAAVAGSIAATLAVELRAAELPAWQPLMVELRDAAPLAFVPGFELSPARRLLAAATPSAGHGWWRRWRRRSADRKLRHRLGAAPDVPLDRLTAALDAADAAQAAARLVAYGGTALDPSWTALADAEEALHAVVGQAIRNRSASAARWTGEGRRSAAALAAALRAGRNRRRAALAGLDGSALVRALPLWVGTVADVDDLLPPVPRMFDLVILDEAAHLDQLRAAPVLARAKRALVVGDPRQLRFVSFVADVDVSLTLARHGLAGYGDRLDVRRASAFDVAVGAAPVTYLEEHYRCTPHLIEFSAKRFYGARIALMTRHPGTERVDAIDVVRVGGGHVAGGVNRAEVAAVVAAVRELADRKVSGIGVITPFRDQADALESALLAEFSLDEIERLVLRTGTVHAFQGGEAETVLVSLGLVDGDAPARQRFVADPNLFNVMVTRARERMIVITSLTAGNGIIGDYLEYGASAPRPLASAPVAGRVAGPVAGRAAPAGEWTARLGAELAACGHVVRVGYPVGRWRVDLCVGEGADAVGLICGVHPEGVDAHVERQRALRGVGWVLRDAFASRWAGDPVRAAVELGPELTGP